MLLCSWFMTRVTVFVIYDRLFAPGEDPEDFVCLFLCLFTTGFLLPARILKIFFPEAQKGEASRIGFLIERPVIKVINPVLEGAESKHESMVRQVLVVRACHSCHVPRERHTHRESSLLTIK